MKRSLPAFCYLHRRKSGEYVEFRRGKSVMMKSKPGTPEFALEYARLMNGVAPAPASKSFAALVKSYQKSDRWTRLKPRTRADYQKVLDWVTEVLGPLPVDKMQRKHVIRAQSENSDRTRFANYIVQVMVVLFKHSMDIGWRSDNPASGIDMLKTPEDRKRPHMPPTDEAVALWRAKAEGMPRLIFELGVGTTQRPDDWTRFKWGDYDGASISLSQSKTGARLVIPCTEPLKAALDAEKSRLNPHPARTILTGVHGRPLSYRHMAQIMLAERDRLNLRAFDLHGLRYRGVMELAWAGCDDDEIGSISGHTSKAMIRKYAGEARQVMLARKAQEKRR